jgi:hypothetical protein
VYNIDTNHISHPVRKKTKVDSWEVFGLYSKRQSHPSLAEVRKERGDEGQGSSDLLAVMCE